MEKEHDHWPKVVLAGFVGWATAAFIVLLVEMQGVLFEPELKTMIWACGALSGEMGYLVPALTVFLADFFDDLYNCSRKPRICPGMN